MNKASKIDGFSKLKKEDKIALISLLTEIPGQTTGILTDHFHTDPVQQNRYDSFSENSLSNFYLPYSLAPNFLINGNIYHVPMVTEESSVVAAASFAAKFWLENGGFKAKIKGREKKGQIHFTWTGDALQLEKEFINCRHELLSSLGSITSGMEARGGGITAFSLLDKTDLIPGYFQLDLSFLTADAMGANFINSVLEKLAGEWNARVKELIRLRRLNGDFETLMAILSNYTPDSLVNVTASTEVKNLAPLALGMDPENFAEKFITAVRIAELDPGRAVTHNKGIFNGVDAVTLATANDFRAVEACGHAYAARSGRYVSLSGASIQDGVFSIVLDLPLAVGTTGGLTSLHPLAERSLEILGNPGSDELMMIIASAGLANNFSAIRALVTTGIQKGHMKMHLSNILLELGASQTEQEAIGEYFRGKTITKSTISNFLQEYRKKGVRR